MVSFIILLGATLIIFIIFEQVLMPQLNCQSLLFSKKGKTEKRKMPGRGFRKMAIVFFPVASSHLISPGG